MKHIFTLRGAKSSAFEKSLGGLLAFSVLMQTSFVMPIAAYADTASESATTASTLVDVSISSSDSISVDSSSSSSASVSTNPSFSAVPNFEPVTPVLDVSIVVTDSSSSTMVVSTTVDNSASTSVTTSVSQGQSTSSSSVDVLQAIFTSLTASTSSSVSSSVSVEQTVNVSVSISTTSSSTPGTSTSSSPINLKPIITVIGANPMTVTQSTPFVDLGASAKDIEDGNITGSIVVAQEVNTAILGTYTVSYAVVDSKGLAADTKTRIVNVVPLNPGACKAPLDALLVIDRSGSMKFDGVNPEQPLTQAKLGADAFINTLSTSSDRVGVVTYNVAPTLNSALSNDFAAVKASYLSVNATNGTNIGTALDRAQLEIATNGRTAGGEKRVIILLSDGVPDIAGMTAAASIAETIAKATLVKNAGTIVYTIGLGNGVNPSLMGSIASTPSNYFFAPSGAQLMDIYKSISTIECARQPSTVAGKKIHDVNGNGSVDAGDTGIAGWQIILTEVSGNQLVRRATTTTNGAYTFADVPSGKYNLCEVGKEGWNQTAPSPGVNNGCYSLDVTDGSAVVDKNFLNTEATKPECRDGKDNDNDGKIDFPSDAGCTSTEDNDENEKPIITIVGANPIITTLGSVYTDSSATVADPEDGNITHKLITSGVVDVNNLGTYVITYNATDSKNIAADTKTRSVRVTAACADGKDNDGDSKTDFPLDAGCENPEDNDENSRPVITVVGTNPVDITLGDVYTDWGATAVDPEDGNITTGIVKTGTVNTATLGSYTIRYNVSDSKGLAAPEKTRIVRVNPIVTECNDNKDNDGDNRVDFDGHIVGDMAFAPDSGCDSLEDNDENNRPVITVVGSTTMEVAIGTLFTDPRATVFDAEDGQINNKLVASGTVNTVVLGTYTIYYNATDSKALAAVEQSRMVKVTSSCSDGKDNDNDGTTDYPLDLGCENPEDNSENERPVITLLGDVVMSIVSGGTYTEPSATVFDREDGIITNKLVVAGTVNTNTVGAYTITYNATDSQSLAALTVSRTVNVTVAPCTQNCGGGSNDSPYPGCTNPAATNYNRLANKDDGSCQTGGGGGGGGGGPTPLSIMNERILSVGTTTVTITWNTNIPASSRVVYGLDPVLSLASAPLYGYDLTTVTNSTLTTSHTMTIEGIPSAVSAYFRPVSATNSETKVGIELTRGGVLGESTECFYLREYMRLGYNNNPVEVTKLQSFLRNYEGFATLEVNGFFDLATDKAVRAFQDKYRTDVLATWNLAANTGYVYYTTQKKINEIYCQRTFPLNTTQIAEIASFRLLVKQAVASRGAADAVVATAVSTPPGVGSATDNGPEGIVAGAATIKVESVTGSEGENPKSPTRGRIALADLLATSPMVGESLSLRAESGAAAEATVGGAETKGEPSLLDWEGGEMFFGLTCPMLLVGLALFLILIMVALLYMRTRKNKHVIEIGE